MKFTCRAQKKIKRPIRMKNDLLFACGLLFVDFSSHGRHPNSQFYEKFICLQGGRLICSCSIFLPIFEKPCLRFCYGTGWILYLPGMAQ